MDTVFKILLVISLFSFCSCHSKKGLETLSRDADSSQTEIMESGRTIDLLSSLGNFMLNLTVGGMNFNIPSSGSGNSTACPNNTNMIEALKIPLYIILPAIIVGVIILIKKIGLFTAWIPSVTGPWFKKFKQSGWGSSDEDGDGWSQGGYPSPSSGYGVPIPSPAYGTNSRQTAILESIDNLNNQFNNPRQPQQGQMSGVIPSMGNVADYADDAQNYMAYYYNNLPEQQEQPQHKPQVSQQQPSSYKIKRAK